MGIDNNMMYPLRIQVFSGDLPLIISLLTSLQPLTRLIAVSAYKRESTEIIAGLISKLQAQFW